ncbi:MBL fold metallo-hydrolase [Streptomyces sp. SID13031]|uniref:MBL fold metallo-hydrolase n=1 Tax=Streptomyces sp. SID13031 TaxID=2706046 RepID=UPI0013CCB795|nr:MBL fold metallo-hydrolase [Streptomyces sp. SID13031]NEA30506.1 MBL fold metallo-hydrolase [Streptomyces sp. SID13031]
MPGTLGEQSAVRVWEEGGVRLTFVVDGAMGLVPHEFFPTIPESYWAAHPETLDEHGLVAMSAGGLLVERDGRAVLLDVGLGDYQGPIPLGKSVIGYADSGSLPDVLKSVGRTPEDIEAVAFTHLHVDHTGWAFTAGDDGRPRKYFPKARYLVADSEWAPHGRGELIPGAPPRSAVIEPLIPEHTEIADGEEIFPGVHALVTPGHSPGHTSYVIQAGDTRVIAFGDAFHIPTQISNPGWPSRPDVDGEAVLKARATLLAELAKPGTLGFACHFGDQPFGRVRTGESGTSTWEPVPSTVLQPTPRLLKV